MLSKAAIKKDVKEPEIRLHPVLKWAGGKTQLLSNIVPKLPKSYGKYIEPFIGGGALFFAVQPETGVIADSNPELVNMYKTLASDVEEVIRELSTYENTHEFFYEMRKRDWHQMSSVQAAARTIYLNKTCFNGLYRVNKKGQFNVPYGKYVNPKLFDEENFYRISAQLKKVDIVCGDYKTVLRDYAQKNDFVFLDPPYLPISKYSDFKRYTKEQFYEEDHKELAEEIERLSKIGCHVVMTNSNHPLVHELYGKYEIEVINTKRHISCNGTSRNGEDVIVTIPPEKISRIRMLPKPQPTQVGLYPSTRFMGSKSKLLDEIWSVASNFEFNTVLDLFSGSGIVGYMFKAHGKEVTSNDYMAMSASFTKAMIENSSVKLSRPEILSLFDEPTSCDDFVQKTFASLYFADEENKVIDNIRANITCMRNPYKRAIAMSALIRACIKKRPRGIFTYVGNRYNDGRKDLKMSFQEQFVEAAEAINEAVFDNGKANKSYNTDAMTLRTEVPDLVYIDPPYYSPLSDNEYVRRYHFVEGLARSWKDIEIQENTITKKFKSYPTPFSTQKGAADAFNKLFKKYENSILIVSYSSNSLPSLDEMIDILSTHKLHVEVIPVDYRYSFGNQKNKVGNNRNKVQEYLFVGY